MTFYLFRLPHLASMNIINSMNAGEQFLTSLCSRRTFSVIKTLRRGSRNIILTIGDSVLGITEGDEHLITSQNMVDYKRKEKVTVNGHSTLLTYNLEENSINTLWADPMVGTMELVEHVTSLFGIHVSTVVANIDSGTRLMNWVQQRQESLRLMEVISFNSMERPFESGNLKNILMECTAERIHVDTPNSTEFEIQNLNKKFEVFLCLRGTWITVDNLMTLDCIRIVVKEKKFSCAEMNTLIKHWVNGGSPRLRIFGLPIFEQNYEELLDGIEAQWIDEKTAVSDDDHYTGFFEVVRSDGITAGFLITSDCFWFGVWPRDNRNFLDLNSFS
uniref:FBA_2 domain-containing protein n=1 Tax=Caenorhabditis tropicalis TaxID=1561998 RepID=A0A1I7TJ19_9PELO